MRRKELQSTVESCCVFVAWCCWRITYTQKNDKNSRLINTNLQLDQRVIITKWRLNAMKLIVSIAVVYLIYSLTLIKSFRTSFFLFNFISVVVVRAPLQLIAVVFLDYLFVWCVFSFVNFFLFKYQGSRNVTLFLGSWKEKQKVCLFTFVKSLTFDFLID